MSDTAPRIFCAIDTHDLDHACELVRQIGPVTKGIKLGLEFFNAFGPQGIDQVMSTCPEANLFLDLKYHDIPNTVAGAIKSVCTHIRPAYLNVHASGGINMMKAAKEACPDGTKLIAVTLLTSLGQEDLSQIGYVSDNVKSRVENLACLTKEAGLDGVVCSAHEIETVRAACGSDFSLMVPGIRPAGSASGDQKRVMTPKDAIDAGATHLVIGRPITQSDDPAKAAHDILQSLA